MTHLEKEKIRLVKCPKCARLLPEPEQIPLYTCGGCYTILESKYYKSQKEAFVQTLPTEEVVLSSGNGYTFDIGESSSSSQRSSASGEKFSTQKGNGNENAVDVCISEQIESENYSLPTSLSEELSTLRITKSGKVIGSQQESGEALDEDSDQFASEDHEKSKMENYACETSTGRNVDALENREPQQLATEDEVKIDEYHKQEKCENTAINKEREVGFVSSAKEFALDNVAGGSSSHDENIKMVCDCEISGENVSGNGSGPGIGSQRESGEALDKNLEDFCSEVHVIIQKEQSDGIVVENRDHEKRKKEHYACETPTGRTVDVLEHGESQELATEDEVINDENHKQEKYEDITDKEKEVGFVSSATEFALDNVARGSRSHDENMKMNCDSEIFGETVSRNEINHLAVNLDKAEGSEKKENFVEQIREEVEKASFSGDTTENGNSEQKGIRKPKNDQFPRMVPDYRSSVIGSSSSYAHGEPPSHWTRNHPYEQRRYMDIRGFRDATWREREFHPMYYNDEISEEMYRKRRYFDYYQGYIDRKKRPGSWSLSGTLPQTPYSGVPDQYMGRHSAQLPPAGYYRHWPMTYMDPYGGSRWDPYEFDPYPTNPYGWARDAISDDRRQTNRMYMRENRHAVKRHLKPIAGGAPFITCHFCLRVLQLPEEFIISKQRKRHRLKCSSCSNTLDFSLENESCLAPQINLNRDVGSSSSSQVNHDQRTNSVSMEAHRKVKELLQSESSGVLDREMRQNDTTTPSFRSRQVNVSWQRPTRSKSPLHRLMGYAAPEDLLNGQTADDSE